MGFTHWTISGELNLHVSGSNIMPIFLKFKLKHQEKKGFKVAFMLHKTWISLNSGAFIGNSCWCAGYLMRQRESLFCLVQSDAVWSVNVGPAVTLLNEIRILRGWVRCVVVICCVLKSELERQCAKSKRLILWHSLNICFEFFVCLFLLHASGSADFVTMSRSSIKHYFLNCGICATWNRIKHF
jgi:hypothetical protein